MRPRARHRSLDTSSWSALPVKADGAGVVTVPLLLPPPYGVTVGIAVPPELKAPTAFALEVIGRVALENGP